MASHDSNKSKESSPNHPMVLRSACRLCCTEDLSYSAGGRVATHRSAHVKHLNGDPLHFHHHHHKGYSNTNEKYGEQDAGYVDDYLSNFVDSHSSSATQEEKSSEKIALKLADSLQASSIAHLISSPLSISKVSTKFISSSSANYSSTTSYKEVYSDYSSGNESSGFFCEGEVNNVCLKEDMSRSQIRSRTPLASVRLLSGSDSDNEDNIIKTSVTQGKHNEEERARRVYRLNNSVNESLSTSFLRNDRSKQLHRTESSRRNSFYSGEGSSDENLSCYENHKEEVSFASSFSNESSYACSGFVFTLFRWMFWRCIYLTICKVLLFDTWLLSRCYTYGKRKLFLFLLLFIPLLFLVCTGGNSASKDQLSDAVILESSKDPSFEFSFFSGWLLSRNEEESESTAYPSNLENTQSIWSYLTNLFSSTGKDNSLELKLEVPAESVVSSTYESELDISAPSIKVNDDEKMKLLALEVFRRESAKLLSQFEERRKQDQAEKGIVELKHSDIGQISTKYQSLSASLQEFKNEVSKQIKINMDASPQLLLLGSKLQDLEEKIVSFESALESAKNCCGNVSSYTSAESQLTLMMMKVMEGNEDGNHPIVAAFRNWLRASFISRSNLSDEISSVIKQMYGSLHLSEEHYEDIAKRVAESVISQSMKSFENDIIKMSETISSSFSMGHYSTETSRFDDIQKIIKEAILLYDADKTGRVDYALESGGGSIINTRCSETYNAGTARIIIFGLPLWSSSKSPRTAIQPGVQPGECWAFHGSQGFLVIQLSATIRPNGFSLEHIPKSLSPLGNIDSAPKDFSVWGLMSENNAEGQLLGKFQYNCDGDPVQYFPVENETEHFYSIIELKIHSNWGNQKYTCLYRFRVHGTPL